MLTACTGDNDFFFVRGPFPQSYMPQNRNLCGLNDPCKLHSLVIACNSSLPAGFISEIITRGGGGKFSEDTYSVPKFNSNRLRLYHMLMGL